MGVHKAAFDWNSRYKADIHTSFGTQRWGQWTTLNFAPDVWNSLDISKDPPYCSTQAKF